MLAIETGDVITLIGVAQVVRRERGVGELEGGVFSNTNTEAVINAIRELPVEKSVTRKQQLNQTDFIIRDRSAT